MLKFTTIKKENPDKLLPNERSKNFNEIYANYAKKKVKEQA